MQESISCDKTGDSVGQNGVIFSQTNYVTLKYITDSWGTAENGFKMVITAFKAVTQQGCSKSFQCSSTNTCISDDLVCDTVHHCIDGSDERHSEFCRCKFINSFIFEFYTLLSILQSFFTFFTNIKYSMMLSRIKHDTNMHLYKKSKKSVTESLSKQNEAKWWLIVLKAFQFDVVHTLLCSSQSLFLDKSKKLTIHILYFHK